MQHFLAILWDIIDLQGEISIEFELRAKHITAMDPWYAVVMDQILHL